MKQVKITVLRKAEHKDLIAKYENPISHACDLTEGTVYITDGYSRPEGFCESAWGSIAPFAMALAAGGRDFFDGWMKNPYSALISCNDGFRPVSFLLEAIDMEANEP